LADTGQNGGFEMPDVANDKKTADMVTGMVTPIIATVGVSALVATATALISKLVVTNFKEKDLTGDKEMHPTKDEVNASKVEADLKDTDAAVGKDEVTAKDGDLSAMRTDAAAGDTEAKALEGGASAARTKAGAADIETKGLKMT
jgi:hypothetical protein